MLFFFKALLMIALLGIGYLLLFRIKLLVFQRLLGMALGTVICLFILLPDLSTRVAQWFGINRGVDFIFYVMHVFWTYMIVRLYQRQQQLQGQLTRLIRTLSIQQAEPPAEEKVPGTDS